MPVPPRQAALDSIRITGRCVVVVEALLPYPHIDPVLLKIGPLAIRWYAISYIVGILLSWWVILRALRNPSLWKNPPFNGKRPATADDIGDLVVWATLGIIIGGRVGWDLFYGTILCSVSPAGAFCGGLPYAFLTNPIKLVAVWEGGMSFHGGVIGLAIAIWLFCRRRKLSLLSIGDLITSVAPIGIGVACDFAILFSRAALARAPRPSYGDLFHRLWVISLLRRILSRARCALSRLAHYGNGAVFATDRRRHFTLRDSALKSQRTCRGMNVAH